MNRMLSIASVALSVMAGGGLIGVNYVQAEETSVQLRISDIEPTPRASLPKMDDSTVFKLLLRSQPEPAKSKPARQAWIPRETAEESDSTLAQASFLPDDGDETSERPCADGAMQRKVPAEVSPLKSQQDLFSRKKGISALWGKNDDAERCERFDPNGTEVGPSVRMVGDEVYGNRVAAGAVYTWSAPAIYHHPLYFEQVNLERYGQGPHHAIQPLYSAAHFFATIPKLPYHVATAPPSERVYTLGHHRPGNCAPYQWHRTRFSWKGVAVQGLATAGTAVALP